MLLEEITHGSLREIRLARPPVNALDPGLIAALRAALARAHGEQAAGIVLSGAPGVFSAGLDVPALLQLGRPEMRQTWEQFFGLLADLAQSSVPVCAALTGHSPAGGTVLALFADHRIMAEGAFRIGLNEVQVGLPVPEVLLRALIYLVGERQAARLAVGGLLVDPQEALRVGLVDETAPVAEVIPRALAWTNELVAKPPRALRATRLLARRPLVDAFATVDPALYDVMVDAWFSDETQAVLRALVTRLGKGNTKTR
jgi:Delta3-Delta2-enoyl-CoA isomerase